MADVIGRGVIEVSADASKLKAGIDDAKRSIKSFGKDVSDSVGTASARASKSIDNYVKSLQTAAATNGKSTREIELYKLALRGASEAQLGAASSALRMNEAYQQGVVLGNQLRVGFLALAAAAGTAAVAAAAGTIALIDQVGKYQDLAEKIGDTATNISSLKTASDVSGTSLDTIATASVKLTAALSKTDDESKSVGAAIEALGLNFDKFKQQSPVEQLEAVSRAFAGFADGSEKTAVAVSLFGKSGAELLGFLKEYADEGLNAAYVTEEQAKAADDYADSAARMKSQVHQFLQVAAVNAIPILNDVADLFKSISKEQEGTSTATEIVKGAMNGLVVIFQALVVAGSDVIFTFSAVGREIGAIAAQLAALGRLDFKGFSAISDAVKEDAQRARSELDKFQARVMSIGQPKVAETGFGTKGQEDRGFTPAKPRLNISGLNQDKTPKGKKDNSAAHEAKAQLALDLDEIRKAQDALSNTINNSEKVMQAKRDASLISEAEYYAQKRSFIEANDRVQQEAAQKEIDRLQKEVLTGKDKIDNDRKIVDAQAKLAKLRENATTNLQVLAIREKDSLDSIARAYADAREAAQSYLDVTNRARQLELDSMGKGNKARDFGQAISQITEKYEEQRQALQRDNRNGKFKGREADYERELALLNEFQGKSIASYSEYYDKLNEKQKDFSLGATEALQNYADESANVFKQTEEAVTNAFKGMEDALVEFTTTGKLDFKSLADSIIKDITRIIIKQQITGPLASMIGGALGGGGSSSGVDSAGYEALISKLANGGRAIGGPVHAGGLYRINENGPGEVFETGNKQWFMPGSDGEVKTSAQTASARGGDTYISIPVNGRVDRETRTQIANSVSLEQRRARRLA
jgi:lambda family phage tail tape measure protein